MSNDNTEVVPVAEAPKAKKVRTYVKTKYCNGCKRWLKFSHYTNCSAIKGSGKKSRCKDCMSVVNRKYYDNRKLKMLELQRGNAAREQLRAEIVEEIKKEMAENKTNAPDVSGAILPVVEPVTEQQPTN